MKMKPDQQDKELPLGFTIDPSLNGKYDHDPYFKEKLDEANDFLRKHPIPKELLEQRAKK